MDHQDDYHDAKTNSLQHFGVISVLGAPGAGKGTLCSYLAEQYNLSHFSIGDSLRVYVRENPDDPLSARINNKLSHQGFLSSSELDPFLDKGLSNALDEVTPKPRGIILDGYPRLMEQIEPQDAWLRTTLPLTLGKLCITSASVKGQSTEKPDVVLFLDVAKGEAKSRFLARARDRGDNDERFERRYGEFEKRSLPVIEEYRRRGVLITTNANGSKEESKAELVKELETSELWKTVVQEIGTEGRLELAPWQL